MGFKRCSIGTKVRKVCQENIPHTITPPSPPAAWTVETRQDRSMISCSLCQILTIPSECRSRNQDSSDETMFFKSSIVQFWWACVNCILHFLFLVDRMAPGVVFCCWSTSDSGFDVLCVQRWYSAYLGCNEWLFELLLPFYHLYPVYPFSSDPWNQQGIFVYKTIPQHCRGPAMGHQRRSWRLPHS